MQQIRSGAVQVKVRVKTQKSFRFIRDVAQADTVAFHLQYVLASLGRLRQDSSDSHPFSTGEILQNSEAFSFAPENIASFLGIPTSQQLGIHTICGMDLRLPCWG